MLVLTRHIDESIWIGPDITVKILGVSGGVVRIGINAPKEVPVDREEIGIRKNIRPPKTYEDYLLDPQN